MDSNMNIEDAYAILNPETSVAKLAEYRYFGGFHGKEVVEKAIEEARQLGCKALLFKKSFDELYIIHEDKEYLKQLLKEISEICNEYDIYRDC